MNKDLLEIIACPRCQGRLKYQASTQQLICSFENIAYPIENGIPVLLAEKAVSININTDSSNNKMPSQQEK